MRGPTSTNPLEPFVGRVPELAALRSGLESALAGHGRLFLLAGDPGIGKTRTAEVLCEDAANRGATILVGRGFEGEGTPPFWPWVQIVRSCAADLDAVSLSAALGRAAADVAHVVPEIAEKLSLAASPAQHAADGARFRFFDGVTTFLKTVALPHGCVLVLDDLHWADRDSILLLHFLARELSRSRILIIGTYRDTALAPNHPLGEVLGELLREPACQHLPLTGLAEVEVAELVTLSTRHVITPSIAASVYQRTEGNPFFVREAVQFLLREGGGTDAEVVRRSIPPSVRAVIGSRLRRLSPPCHALLRVAAVVGRDFSFPILQSIVGNCHPSVAIDSIPRLLDEALAASIIRATTAAPGTYEFSHALIAEAFYLDTDSQQRMLLHQCVASVLEALPEPQRNSHLGRLAHHYLEAARGGHLADKAVLYATLAAQRATALFAFDEAALHYERALEALDLSGAGASERCTSLLALGTAHKRTGNTAAARRAFSSAASLARRLHAVNDFVRAAISFEETSPGVGVVDLLAVSLLEEALIMLPAGDSRERALVLAWLTAELFFSPASERRLLLGRQALEMARRVGDSESLLVALVARRGSTWGQSSLQEQLAYTSEMLEVARKRGDIDGMMSAHHLLINDWLECGDIEEVDNKISRFAHLVAEYPQPKFRWWLETERACRALISGRFEEAETIALEALQIGQRFQPATAGNFFGVLLYSLRRQQGRLDEIAATVAEFAQRYAAVPSWQAALAGLYAEIGQAKEARQHFEPLAANHFADLPLDNSWLVGMTLLAETCVFLKDRRRAEILYELLLPHAHRVVVAGTAAACDGSVARHLGILAACRGLYEVACDHFADALQRNQALRSPPFVARTQLELGSMLLDSKHQDARWPLPQVLLQAAHATATTYGMRTVAERAAALLLPDNAVVTTDSPATTAMRSRFECEGDVWLLAFGGQICRVKNSKGLRYIALLLQHSGREFPAFELPQWTERRAGLMADAGDAGELLDAQAIREYRSRVRAVQDELEEAEQLQDLGLSERLRGELAILTEQLAGAVGLGGRSRRAGSAFERARLSTTKAIKAAVQRIADVHPALGHHLRTSIRTGAVCSYVPDPTKPTEWEIVGNHPS